jgi:hypothetical protein
MRFSCLRLALSVAAVSALSGCSLLIDADADRVGGPDGDDHQQDESPSSDPDASVGDPSDCDGVDCASGSHCEATACEDDVCPARCVPDQGGDGDGDNGDGDGDGDQGDGDGDGPEPPTCASVVCKEGTDCVDTNQGPKCLPHQENPCNLTDCPDGQTCELQDGDAVCVSLPESCGGMTCDEGTTCMDTDEGKMCVPDEDNPCLDEQCDADETCQIIDGRAECVDPCERFECDQGQHCDLVYPPCVEPVDPDLAPNCDPRPLCVDDVTCAAVSCGHDEYCDDSSGRAECKPLPTCDGYDCDQFYECQLVPVDCLVQPCPPPSPTCVFVGEPCGNTTCREGEHCVSLGGVLKMCRPDIRCGDNSCSEGEYCCNESCGICKKLGKQCNQDPCDD